MHIIESNKIILEKANAAITQGDNEAENDDKFLNDINNQFATQKAVQ